MPFTQPQRTTITAKLEELEPHLSAYVHGRENLFRLLAVDSHFADNAELMSAVRFIKARMKDAADAISAALV